MICALHLRYVRRYVAHYAATILFSAALTHACLRYLPHARLAWRLPRPGKAPLQVSIHGEGGE